MEIVIAIVSLTIGSLVTWFVSHIYYRRSSNTFENLVGKLDKLAQSDRVRALLSQIQSTEDVDQVEVKTSRVVQTSSSSDLYPRIQYLMKDVENVLSKHGMQESPDTGGLTISELGELLERFEGIIQLIEGYRNWRVHVGD